MNRILLTLVFIFVTIYAFSQITVTDNDIIGIGDNIYEAIDDVSGSAIQIGSSGANQTWDFSTLQQSTVNIIEHVDPSTTYYGSLHSISNICALDDGQSLYFKKSSSAIELVGIDDQPLINPILSLPLPLTYLMDTSTSPVLGINESFYNDPFSFIFVEDSIAPLITSGSAHKVDSIKVQALSESSYNVDGYGDVIIPMGTFSALRVAVVSTNTTDVYLYCSDTLSGVNSGWYTAPPQLLQGLPLPTGTEIDYFYQWWSNDPSVKFALVNIDVDANGYNDGKIQFLTTNMASIENRNDLRFSIFPIPATYSLNIESEKNLTTSVKLKDINGRLILKKEFNTSITLCLNNLAKGIYYLNLNNMEGELIKKIVIE